VQAPSPKRPKKLKVERQGETPKKGEEAERGHPPLKHNNSDRAPLPGNAKNGHVLQDCNSKHQWSGIAYSSGDARAVLSKTGNRHHSPTGSGAVQLELIKMIRSAYQHRYQRKWDCDCCERRDIPKERVTNIVW